MVSKWNPNSPSWRLRKAGGGQYMQLLLTNDYHGTSYTLRTRWYRPLSKEQVSRCRQTLCPEPGCWRCEGALKERGPQDVFVRSGFDINGDECITLEPVRGKLGGF